MIRLWNEGAYRGQRTLVQGKIPVKIASQAPDSRIKTPNTRRRTRSTALSESWSAP